jgi:hypothetical protein
MMIAIKILDSCLIRKEVPELIIPVLSIFIFDINEASLIFLEIIKLRSSGYYWA